MAEDKIFYSIAEVSEKTDLPKYVIRFWETEFTEINPDRRQGRRYYRQSDIDTILEIKDLLYKKGFTIKGAKKFLHEQKSANGKNSKRVFDDFKMNEEAQSLEPVVQSSKILKRYSFTSHSILDSSSKEELAGIIDKLVDIERILKN